MADAYVEDNTSSSSRCLHELSRLLARSVRDGLAKSFSRIILVATMCCSKHHFFHSHPYRSGMSSSFEFKPVKVVTQWGPT